MDIHSLAATAGNWLNLLSQHGRLIEIDSALDGALVVERFRGHEAICADYRFDIDCLSPSATLDLDALVAQPVALRLRDADGGHRHWHGWCTHAAALGSDGGFARYRLRLEPWTAFLHHRRNALVFQDLDVRGVLERVFADYPQAKWRFDATQSLAKPAITTQFRESDHAFVTRLLADAGLAWRFEHAQSADGVATLVVFDRDAAVPDAQPASLRFHRSDATESLDAITAFAEQRQAVADAIGVASWQAEQVEATSAQLTAEPAGPHVPSREVYAVPRAGRYVERAQAELEAELQLDALRLPRRLHAGSGSGRGVDAGAAFTLTQHPDLSGQAFVPLLVEHVAANNLSTSASHANDAGHGVAALLDAAGTERGSYRNRFLAVPRDTAIVPLPRPRPLAPGAQTARVVGLPEAANTANREHQVRIQFGWQRGSVPNPGGLSDTGSSAHPDGHAPGNETSGTWVRVAEWLAGPNWGSNALPRIGSEVLVEFLHADIDQPVVTGQLYNGEVAPPFAAGIDGDSNHPGTLSGLHTQSLDGGGQQQWLLDDAPGQLRQRLHTTLADSRLEIGYLVQHSNGQRGALRGQGFDLATLGWGNVRAGDGLLLSASARGNAVSTQLDVAEAVAQLKGAQQTAKRLDDTLKQQQVAPLQGNEPQTAFIATLDAGQDGRYHGEVAGQSATKPAPGQRDGGDPVERFAKPLLFVEGPDQIALATPSSALAYAGGHLHLTVQDDAHLAAGQTVAGVSGAHLVLFAQKGPLRAIAANGPLSLQAHAGTLELLADQSVTVTATDQRIDVMASKKIVLQAGQTQVTLEGGDITFACPGNFTVKASEQPFKGGASNAASLDALPLGTTSFATVLELRYTYDDLKPVVRAPYRIEFENGTRREGQLDADGYAEIENPPGPGIVYYGFDQREAFALRERPANALHGFRPTSPEEAKAALERYLAQEAEYMKDHYFPDEVAAIDSGADEFEDLIADYEYDGEAESDDHDDDDSPGSHEEVLLTDNTGGHA